MKGTILLSLLTLLTVCFFVNFQVNPVQLDNEEFKQWKSAFNKEYSSEAEEIYRLNIFLDNLQQISTHNRLNKSYQKGVNQFTDLTEE